MPEDAWRDRDDFFLDTAAAAAAAKDDGSVAVDWQLCIESDESLSSGDVSIAIFDDGSSRFANLET